MIKGDRPVLIYRIGSLGDTVAALPSFHLIERAYPDRQRFVLTNQPISSKAPSLASILQGSGLIHDVINYPIGLRSPKKVVRLIRMIRATRARTLVYLAPIRGARALYRDLLLFRLCGLTDVIGAPNCVDLRENRENTSTGLVEHEAERLVRCLQTLGTIDLAERESWDLRLTAVEKAAAITALEGNPTSPFIVVNMGGKLAANDWGQAKWESLIDSAGHFLRARFRLIAVGGPEDALRSEKALERWRGSTLNLCGKLQPRETAAVLEGAQAFIGHDSGPMHLAAAMGVPTLGLFGANNRPGKWHPYGSGNRALHDMRGVEAITVTQTQQALLQLLSDATGRQPS